MKTITKFATSVAVAAVTSTGAFAADIALVIGSNQDSFWNVVKKVLRMQPWS